MRALVSVVLASIGQSRLSILMCSCGLAVETPRHPSSGLAVVNMGNDCNVADVLRNGSRPFLRVEIAGWADGVVGTGPDASRSTTSGFSKVATRSGAGSLERIPFRSKQQLTPHLMPYTPPYAFNPFLNPPPKINP